MLKQLREKRAKLVADMRGMITAAETADRDFSAEEQAAYDALQAEKDGLDTRIGRLEGQEAAETALNVVIPAASRRGGIERAGGPEAAKEFESMGEFLHAVRFRPSDQRLNFVEGVGHQPDDNGMQAEMRMDNDTSGGFMVPTQLRNTLLSVRPQDALVRPRATVLEAGDPPDAGVTMPAIEQGGANPGNMFGGMTFSWIEEGGEKLETDADLSAITLTPHEIAGFVTVTDKLLRNWRASASFLEGQMRSGVSAAEDYAFLRGNGVTQPLGAINAPAMKYINRTTALQVTYVDLLKMVAVLLMRGGVPVWSMPQSAIIPLAQLTDPEGHYIWKPDARDGFAGTLLGYPVRWNNRAPALGVKGDIILADWSYYLIKDGSGPFVAASEHVKFTQNKTVIKIFWNVDGAPWMKAPIKEENGYEVSPFVGLDIPA
ncbi:phage major capsid protein [Neorhizobium galegae]|uniref:phage major capsid protein n=1 Tax=Neorhizobium galegae TaxID=399 RepID=UPI001F4793B9|nr:phage major capsid protein [Neorhizobium galegae]UIK04900.1 phage major capsid protein [Neorhizobium galegae]